jgi:uncharacterized protein (TIGR00369 family)
LPGAGTIERDLEDIRLQPMARNRGDAASEGRAELQLAWRSAFGQYSGFLHAGIVGALIDTTCGFAAASVTATVLASHYSVNFFRPAVAARFIAQGRIVKLGKRQTFCRAEVYGDRVEDKRLLASGETILMMGE